MNEHRNPQAKLPKPQTHHNPDTPTLVRDREACTIPKATLEEFLNHAACAARIVGHLDGAIADGPLGDHVDELVHGLTELLGDPHMLAAPVQGARSTFALDVDAVPEHAAPDAPAASCTISIAIDGGTRHDLARLSDPDELGGAFDDDLPTQPHVAPSVLDAPRGAL